MRELLPKVLWKLCSKGFDSNGSRAQPNGLQQAHPALPCTPNPNIPAVESRLIENAVATVQQCGTPAIEIEAPTAHRGLLQASNCHTPKLGTTVQPNDSNSLNGAPAYILPAGQNVLSADKEPVGVDVDSSSHVMVTMSRNGPVNVQHHCMDPSVDSRPCPVVHGGSPVPDAVQSGSSGHQPTVATTQPSPLPPPPPVEALPAGAMPLDNISTRSSKLHQQTQQRSAHSMLDDPANGNSVASNGSGLVLSLPSESKRPLQLTRAVLSMHTHLSSTSHTSSSSGLHQSMNHVQRWLQQAEEPDADAEEPQPLPAEELEGEQHLAGSGSTRDRSTSARLEGTSSMHVKGAPKMDVQTQQQEQEQAAGKPIAFTAPNALATGSVSMGGAAFVAPPCISAQYARLPDGMVGFLQDDKDSSQPGLAGALAHLSAVSITAEQQTKAALASTSSSAAVTAAAPSSMPASHQPSFDLIGIMNESQYMTASSSCCTASEEALAAANRSGTTPSALWAAAGVERTKTIAVASHCPEDMRAQYWTLGDFNVIRKMHEGTLSVVCLAQHKRSGRQVALKIYKRSRLHEMERFQLAREICLHIRVMHPYIVPLYAAWKDAKYVYLALEWASKGNLLDYLVARGGLVPEAEAARRVIRPLLAALAFLHSQQFIHRDVKLENIVLDAAGDIKLADFGLAIDQKFERATTRLGTYGYFAPEMLDCPVKQGPFDCKDDSAPAYDSKVDVWSVGVLAYELMTGKAPFAAPTVGQIVEAIRKRALEFPGHLSPGACDFLRAALQRDASQRPTAKQLMKHPWVVECCASPLVFSAPVQRQQQQQQQQ